MLKSLVVADDLTGANDTSVKISNKGFKVQVLIDVENIEYDFPYIVVDTESRLLKPKKPTIKFTNT